MRTLTNPVVMHVIYALEHGGTERFLCRLLNRLAGDRVRHVLCTLRAAGERAVELDPRIQVIPLNLKPRDRWGFVKLARTIRNVNAAIVHARNINTWTDTLLACRFMRSAVPVLGFHGTQSPNGMTPSQRRRFRMLGISKTDCTSVSHTGKQLLIDELGCAPNRVGVLTNGVDTTRFRPADSRMRNKIRARWGLVKGDLVIGNVGNLFSAVKGHDVLLDAFARIIKREPSARLLIAGFGPRLTLLQQQVEQLGIANRVQFLGAIEDVESVFAALDIYVCPSISEGMSNAQLEAMACGIPCVATDVADHRRIFEEARKFAQSAPPIGEAKTKQSRACIMSDKDMVEADEWDRRQAPVGPPELIPAQDPDAMAKAILQLAHDDQRRAQWANAGKTLIETHYSFETAFKGYQQLYDKMLPHADRAGFMTTRIETEPCKT